jgi:HD superfamily phosphohydrolase
MKFYDPIYGRLDLPDYTKKILLHPSFRRLQHLRQLGLCYLAFPGGNHTRFEHSIGAFHIASLLTENLLDSGVGNSKERARLAILIRVAALCHDIGHGPFSHMSENILIALGCELTHEEVGAAIIQFELCDALSVLSEYDISPEHIASIITKTHHPDLSSISDSAISIISSDIDVDRIDYLLRDSHYSGFDYSRQTLMNDLQNMWRFDCKNGDFTCELTSEGVRTAESILMLRRDNYRRVVFNSHHMSATAMFEKAMLSAVETPKSALCTRIQETIASSKSWKTSGPNQQDLDSVKQMYSLLDFEALDLLESSSSDSNYLISRIRQGKVHEPVFSLSWEEIHHSARQEISKKKGPSSIFLFRRWCESHVADTVKIDEKHIAISIAPLKFPSPLLFGIQGGKTLHDASELSRFLAYDSLKQYHIEIYVDVVIGHAKIEEIKGVFINMFQHGTTSFHQQ